MFMFAQSFSAQIRIYSIPEALDFQQSFDKTLGPAVITIFLSTVLSNSKLTEKYILSTVHLNTWNSLQRTLWPILKFLMYRHYDLSRKSVERAWQVVEDAFKEVDEQLSKDNGRQYIAGETLTAADISFASHAALVLFPNEADDTFASHLGLKLPSLKELPKTVAEKAKTLRQTKAGKHAIRMYRKERVSQGDGESDGGYRSFPSKHSKENNPWWSQEGGHRLKMAIYSVLLVLILILNGCLLFLPAWAFVLSPLVFMGAGYWAYKKYIKGTVLDTRLSQIYFTIYTTPVPTERDKIEAEQENKDKASAEVNEETRKTKGGDVPVAAKWQPKAAVIASVNNDQNACSLDGLKERTNVTAVAAEREKAQ
jgi:hypothetical protein